MLRSTGTNIGLVNRARDMHPRYHFFGYAPDQGAGNSRFFDRSALGNHANRGSSLSDATLFGTAGFVTTTDPVSTGSAAEVLRMPAVNFDYNAGEMLIGFWIGQVTPEGSAVEFMGDGGYSTSYPGFGVRVTTGNKAQLKCADGTATAFAGTTTTSVFDGTTHSLGFYLNGAARTACYWTDGVLDAINASGGIAFNSSNAIDMRTTNTINIGTTLPASAGSAIGIATKTKALHIIRLASTDSKPSDATLSTIMAQLHATQGSVPIVGSAF